MGLRYRDLMVDVSVDCAGPAPECAGCTQSGREPACTKVSNKPNPNQRPANCPRASAGKPPKKRLGGLDLLRSQLREELRS